MNKQRLVQLARWYSNATRGKKLKPTKANIVVLSPKEAGLLGNKQNKWMQRNRNSKPGPGSLLEGIEIEYSDSLIARARASARAAKDADKGSADNSGNTTDAASTSGVLPDSALDPDLFSEGEKLLKFSKHASMDQLFQTIESLKPALKTISLENYEKLERQLTDSFTIKQLRAYTNKMDQAHRSITSSRLVKHKLINQLVTKLWDCTVSHTLANMETKTIKLSKRHSKLLLLTHNGKILRNLTRLDSKLALQLNLSQNELKITSTPAILKFIEISLNNILKNVSTSEWNPPIKVPEEQLNLITRIAGVDITENEIAAFGFKRIELAKRLVRWIALKDDTQFKSTILEEWRSTGASDIKWFPFSDMECLDWLSKNGSWGRQQQVELVNTEKEKKALNMSEIVTEEQIDKLYDYFRTQVSENKHNITSDVSSITSISLGAVLENANKSQHIFQPCASSMSEKILNLPADVDVNGTEDINNEPSYYVEITFAPSPQSPADAPPIKILVELDDNNNVIFETAQCLAMLSSKECLIQTPEAAHDYKITHDEISDVFEYDDEGMLLYQPDAKDFLDSFMYNPNNLYEDSIGNVTINMPLSSAGNTSVEYEFVSMNHHAIKRLRYMDKYSVQYSNVTGRNLGGNYTQIEFSDDTLTNKLLDRAEFSKFIKDIMAFS